MNFKQITALMQNDLKDLRRNTTVFLLIVIPPLLAFLTNKVSGSPGTLAEVLPMWLVYGQILVGMNLLALGLSEEKEKKTLEAVMVSPVSMPTLITAKVLFALIITLIVQFLTAEAAGGFIGNIPLLAIVSVFGTLFFAGIGLVIGILLPNQKAAGAASTPVMLLLLLGPMMAGLAPWLRKAAEYLPSLNAMELYRIALVNGAIGSGSIHHAVSLALWAVAAGAASIMALRRISG